MFSAKTLILYGLLFSWIHANAQNSLFQNHLNQAEIYYDPGNLDSAWLLQKSRKDLQCQSFLFT